jgi:uncharacterized membrane protein
MFGERYFATRERLGEVVNGILSIAKATGVDTAHRMSQDVLDQGLATPFLFVVCGEVNAGKSTLLNSLFGQQICKVNILPETDRVIWYKYGPERKDVSVTDVLLEHYVPIEFLKDFNLVDTPGTNSIEKTHQGISERFMPVADLLLFVFPVSNPWGAATWDFLCRQPDEILDRVVFILQQADQREPEDIPVILDHLRDLAMKRIGRIPPVFAVSGKMAFEAKLSLPFSESKRRNSGIIEIEDFISKSVCDSPSRKKMLHSLHRAASRVMQDVEDRIEDHARIIERDGRFLEEMEREIDAMRVQVIRRNSQSLGGTGEAFQLEAREVAKILKNRMGIGKSITRLITGEDTAQLMEGLIQDRLRGSVEDVSSQDFAELIRLCCDHWEALRSKVKNAMGIEIETVAEIEQRLIASQGRFVKRMGRESSQGIGNLRVRVVLDIALRQRNAMLKGFLIVGLLMMIGAGVCGALSVPLAPWILLGLSAMSILILFFLTMQSGKEIVSEYRERLLNSGDTFVSALRGQYEEGLRLFFQDYALGLEAVRKHLAKQKQQLAPRLERWNGLFLGLKAIEQELT